MVRTWKEILHSGELPNDLLVAELESAIEHSEDEYYTKGWGEGEQYGQWIAEVKECDRIQWLKELDEGYGQ